MNGPGRPGGPAGPGPPGHLHRLAAGFLAARADTPGGWPEVLAAAAVNLRHGFVSAISVAAQKPGAGPVATYDQWRDAGWQPRRGEKAGIWITRGPKPEAVFTRGQVRAARARVSPPVPGAAVIQAASPDHVLGILTAFARHRGYSVVRDADAASACIDPQQRTVAVPAGLAAGQAAAALAHQLGHLAAGSEHPAGTGREGGGCHGTVAVEADSVAWLVLARLGMDPAAAGITFPAARSWAAPDPRTHLAGVLTAAGDRIVRAAAEITAHAEKVLAALPAPPPPHRDMSERAALQPAAAGHSRQARPGRAARVSSGPAWIHPDQDLVRVNTAAAAFFRSHLEASWAAGYLARRGFGPAICRRWQLGYAPAGWTGLVAHLRQAGFADSLIEAAGLAFKTRRGTLADVFRDRVMIPVRGPHGQIVAFAGRAPDNAPDGTPKYLNTKRTPIYTKDHLLDGLAESGAALAAGARPVLVEGYFDRIAVTEAGRLAGLAGVSTGGTALSRHQMDALAAACDLRDTPLLVAVDPDTAGQKAAARGYRIINAYCPEAGTPVLPAGRDPAKVFEAGGPEALAEMLTAKEHPLADVAVDAAMAPWAGQLQWAEGQLHAVRAAGQLLARVPPADPVRQIARVAQATGVPHLEVAGEFAKAMAAAEPPPKGTGLAGTSPGSRPHTAATPDFPAAPALGRRARGSRRGGTLPRLPGARPPPRHR